MKANHARLVGAAVAMFGLAMAGPASAAFEMVPAARCIVEGSSGDGANPVYDGAGLLLADTGSITVVTCPLIHTSSLPLNSITAAEVDVDNEEVGDGTEFAAMICAYANNGEGGTCGDATGTTAPQMGAQQYGLDTSGLAQDLNDISYPTILLYHLSSTTDTTFVTHVLGFYAGS